MINFTLEDKISLSPANLIFIFSEEDIAKQLTLIDFSIYKAIKVYFHFNLFRIFFCLRNLPLQPAELLNQAWSKAKYKYRAKNVLSLVNRSTHLARWVASVITWQTTLKGRVRAMTKMIKLAQVCFLFFSFRL